MKRLTTAESQGVAAAWQGHAVCGAIAELTTSGLIAYAVFQEVWEEWPPSPGNYALIGVGAILAIDGVYRLVNTLMDSVGEI